MPELSIFTVFFLIMKKQVSTLFPLLFIQWITGCRMNISFIIKQNFCFCVINDNLCGIKRNLYDR